MIVEYAEIKLYPILKKKIPRVICEGISLMLKFFIGEH